VSKTAGRNDDLELGSDSDSSIFLIFSTSTVHGFAGEWTNDASLQAQKKKADPLFLFICLSSQLAQI